MTLNKFSSSSEFGLCQSLVRKGEGEVTQKGMIRWIKKWMMIRLKKGPQKGTANDKESDIESDYL